MSEWRWRTDYIDADDLGPEDWTVYLSDQPTYVDALKQAVKVRGFYEVHDVPSFSHGNAEDAAWAEDYLNRLEQAAARVPVLENLLRAARLVLRMHSTPDNDPLGDEIDAALSSPPAGGTQ